jgi:hypothetical protein
VAEWTFESARGPWLWLIPFFQEVELMKRIFAVIAVLGLGLGATAATGCVSEDSAITCDNLDGFMLECYGNCTGSWDCELYYEGLAVEDQLLLDDCSDCLMANLNDGLCDDCQIDDGYGSLYYCTDLLTNLLGVDCTW